MCLKNENVTMQQKKIYNNNKKIVMALKTRLNFLTLFIKI